MLEKTLQETDDWQGEVFELLSSVVAVAEGHRATVQRRQAQVGTRHAKDATAQLLQHFVIGSNR